MSAKMDFQVSQSPYYIILWLMASLGSESLILLSFQGILVQVMPYEIKYPISQEYLRVCRCENHQLALTTMPTDQTNNNSEDICIDSDDDTDSHQKPKNSIIHELMQIRRFMIVRQVYINSNVNLRHQMLNKSSDWVCSDVLPSIKNTNHK